jgi:hypothetical protein
MILLRCTLASLLLVCVEPAVETSTVGASERRTCLLAASICVGALPGCWLLAAAGCWLLAGGSGCCSACMLAVRAGGGAAGGGRISAFLAGCPLTRFTAHRPQARRSSSCLASSDIYEARTVASESQAAMCHAMYVPWYVLSYGCIAYPYCTDTRTAVRT